MEKVYRLCFVILLVVLFLAGFFHPVTAINVDLGRHILLGKIIATTHHVPKTNLLSYTYKDFLYINTSWLTDVIYYYLFVWGGFNVLLLVNTLFIAFSFGILIWYATKRYRLSLGTFFSITLYLLLLSLRPDVRPEVMSMVCIALFMVVLFASRKGDKKILWVLIPIELLWVNLHIYFFVGPLLVLLFLIDALIIHAFQFARVKEYMYVFAGTLLATAINPSGIEGALFPLTVLQNYGFPVVENQSLVTLFTVYHSTEVLLPIITIFLLFIILFATRKKTAPIDWLLTIVFSVGAIVIFRNVLLFVFATFIPFIKQLNFLENKYWPFFKKLPKVSYSLFYPLSLLLLLLFIISSVRVNGFGFGVVEQGKGAVDFLGTHHIQGPLYNNFDIGDYLTYRIYPQLVFVDNRPEAYPASFFQNSYLPMQQNPEIFKDQDARYHFNAVVISYWDNTPWGNNLFRYLINSSNFKLVYLDPYTVVLLRDTSANRTLIRRYAMTEKSLQLYKKTSQPLHYLFFFEKAGWTVQESLTLQLLGREDPHFCSLAHYPIEQTFISNYIATHKITRSCGISQE